MDVGEYIERVRNGDSNSFEPIIRMYQQKIFSYCYVILGNRQEAEDAVQDIFFKAFRYLDSYKDDLSFLAWLYKIAGNHCNTLLKKMKRRFILPIVRSEQEKSAEQIFTERLEAEWLEGLSVREKQILMLRVVEDHTFERIAQILDSDPATVRKRFERMKKKLQKNKNKKEVTLHEHGLELR